MNKKYMVSKAYTTMKIWVVDEAKNQKDELVLSMEVCQMIKPRNAKQMSR